MEVDLLLTQTIAVCSLITGISAVVAIVVQVIRKAKEPNNLQDVRIAKCEEDIANIMAILAKDLKRFERLEDGNRIMQRCMLALLSHGIDGNEIEGMRKAKDDLQNFLINQ